MVTIVVASTLTKNTNTVIYEHAAQRKAGVVLRMHYDTRAFRARTS